MLDEPDSGVDVESLKMISIEIQKYIEATGASALIITHKGDILEYIKASYGCILLKWQNSTAFKDPMRIYEDIKAVGYEECVACRIRTSEGWKNGQKNCDNCRRE